MKRPILVAERQDQNAREDILIVRRALALGWEIRSEALKNLRRGRVDVGLAALVAGTVPFFQLALRQLKIDPPQDDCYPVILERYLHRSVKKVTLRQAIAHVEGFGQPIFIKPAARTKRFTGFVLDTPLDPRLAGLSRSEEIWVCDVVEWMCEWRVYVVDRSVRHISYCDGDRALAPDEHVIMRAVADLADGGANPASYAIDFGVLANGQTALIEVNDGYALGAYEDVSSEVYFDLLLSRWQQLLTYTPS